jgi:DNA repair protein RadC
MKGEHMKKQESYYNVKLKTITLKVKEPEPSETMSSSRACYGIAQEVYKTLDDDQEHFTVFFLNSQNEVKGYKTLFSGGQAYSIVDKAILFKNVLLFGATAIIICHNHPSGCKTASAEDKQVTKDIKECCKLFKIKLLDHIILVNNDYTSMADEAILKFL